MRKRFGVKITFRQLLEDLSSLDAMAAYLADKVPAPASPLISASCLGAISHRALSVGQVGPVRPVRNPLPSHLPRLPRLF